MPWRKYVANSSKYRYGFNGKENDNEVKGEGNQQDYGMRIYDPRLGRFLSVDPLTPDYPELTPYQFASNTPIQATDLDGLEADFSAGKILKRKDYKDYGNFLSNIVGNTIIENNVGNNLSTAVQNQVVDMGEDAVNLASNRGRNKLLHDKYGPAVYELMVEFGTMPANQQLLSLENFFTNAENLENLAASGFLLFAAKYTPSLKVPSVVEPYINLLKKVFSGDKKILSTENSIGGIVKGSLGNRMARIWYKMKEATITSQLNTNLPLETQAKQAFKLRNEYRTGARELMADRKAAMRLAKEEPNLTWKEIVAKYKKEGYRGDKLWNKIIEGSQKSRKSIDKKLGVN